MNCSVWEERIALYEGGDLPAGQMPEVERHLGECAGCQVFASGIKQTLEVLRNAHGDLPADAHFTAVRARVLAEVVRSRRPAWRWVLAASAVATAFLAAAGAARLYRPVPPPAVMALALPPAPIVAARQVIDRPRRVPRPGRRPAERVTETVTIKLVTDNPDVVIYWIAD